MQTGNHWCIRYLQAESYDDSSMRIDSLSIKPHT